MREPYYTIETGDMVFHRPTRELWIVANCKGSELMWCGWPEGYAQTSDCLLVNKATQTQKKQILLDLAGAGGTRAYRARHELEALGINPTPTQPED